MATWKGLGTQKTKFGFVFEHPCPLDLCLAAAHNLLGNKCLSATRPGDVQIRHVTWRRCVISLLDSFKRGNLAKGVEILQELITFH